MSMNRNSMQLKEKSSEYRIIVIEEIRSGETNIISSATMLESTDDRNSQTALSMKVLHTRDGGRNIYREFDSQYRL